MLESAVNHFGIDEIIETNGIQSLINKLKLIQSAPTKQQLQAVNNFAVQLAMIDSNERKRKTLNIRYKPDDNVWEAYRTYRGKRFAKSSKHREVVVAAYAKFCADNGLNF